MVIVALAFIGILGVTVMWISLSNYRMKVMESISPVIVPVGGGSKNDLRERVKQVIGVDLYKAEDE